MLLLHFEMKKLKALRRIGGALNVVRFLVAGVPAINRRINYDPSSRAFEYAVVQPSRNSSLFRASSFLREAAAEEEEEKDPRVPSPRRNSRLREVVGISPPPPPPRR